ncbi:hypothetical protein AX17_003080 [Amanita inopinata Kibby_2008]|nr:hypothetical protein AX17_003080 [Amanita inopinata Kibby_2008]
MHVKPGTEGLRNDGVTYEMDALLRSSLNNTIPQHKTEASTPSQKQLPFRVKLGALIEGGTDDSQPLRQLILKVVYGVILVGLFGAIHCFAWNSRFPTPIESGIWRISSIIALTVSTTVFVAMHVNEWLDDFSIVVVALSFFYACARVCLLVVALMALRALPYEAYVTPSWTLYIPHFT